MPTCLGCACPKCHFPTICAEYPAFFNNWGIVGIPSGRPFTEPWRLANGCPVLNEYLPVIRADLNVNNDCEGFRSWIISIFLRHEIGRSVNIILSTWKGYTLDGHNDLLISDHLLQACRYLEWVSIHHFQLLNLFRLPRKFYCYIRNLPSQHHQSEWKWYSALKKISVEAWRLCIRAKGILDASKN